MARTTEMEPSGNNSIFTMDDEGGGGELDGRGSGVGSDGSGTENITGKSQKILNRYP
jgi:hypothetical protein